MVSIVSILVDHVEHPRNTFRFFGAVAVGQSQALGTLSQHRAEVCLQWPDEVLT